VFIIPEMSLGQIAKEVGQYTNIPIVTAAKLGGALHTADELRRAVSAAKDAVKSGKPVTEVRL
ncbi:MAG TPA: 2-oxoacid:acceptor oxidoreductase subunit alpha, partial [Methanocorpusculum sp.]|nr:2-oxoacid:acceptor oxidoreductase subunit alpha [Methanocorpusculum sp.]